MADATHKDLCLAAVRWLRLPPGRKAPACTVAFSEVATSCGQEIADAFGVRAVFGQVHSVLVEAKVSRADFLADAGKPHRQPGAAGLGTYRYYITPPGLIGLDELPDRWGLIEWAGRSRFSVLAGHVLERYRPGGDLIDVICRARWAHPADLERDLGIVTRVLSKVGDHNHLQELLKESRRIASRQADTIQRLHRDIQALRQRYHELAFGQQDTPSTTSTVVARGGKRLTLKT